MRTILGWMVFCLLVMPAALRAEDFTKKKQVKLGQSVETFQLKSADGSVFDLAAQKGKIVVLHFWSAKCPFVVRYEERIQALVRDYTAKGVVFAGVDSNVNDSLAEIKKVSAERKVNYPILLDEGNIIADRFGAITTPHVFIVDKEGRLAYEGAVDNQGWSENKVPTKHYIRQALDALLSGKKVKPAKSLTAGCTIKRKPV